MNFGARGLANREDGFGRRRAKMCWYERVTVDVIRGSRTPPPGVTSRFVLSDGVIYISRGNDILKDQHRCVFASSVPTRFGVVQQ